jgi:AcrR family transcriptional regulator
MASNKSRAKPGRGAVEPRRRPGKERVAALMEAAATVIAEKGYEAATMAEIAARAGALVGSLYHFFPSKEALAEALIRRYEGIVGEAFARIDDRAASMPVEELADALIGLMVEIRGESKAMVALLDARAEWSAKRQEFMDASLRRIARTLSLKSPGLPPEAARHMAAVLMHNMKAMKALVTEYGEASGAVAELRDMTRLYLASKLRGKA